MLRRQEVSKSQHGDLRKDLDAAEAAGLDIADYWVKQSMERAGTPWTRENFIEAKWRGELPTDADTGLPYVPEDEIPADLRGP